MPVEVYVGRVRSVVLLWLLSIVTLGLWSFVWFIQLNRDLARHLRRGRPGGRFALFLLIPVIGWFFATLMTGRSVRAAQINAGNDRLVAPSYHAVWAALVPVLGWLIALGYLQRGANRAWLKMDQYFTPGSAQQSRVQCPDCDNLFLTLWNPVISHGVRCPQCGRTGDV